MKKLMLLVAALALALVVAVPAFAQENGEDVNGEEEIITATLEQNQTGVNQTGTATATAGDANAAAGNQFAVQNQTASNTATVEQNVEQSQSAEFDQFADASAVAGSHHHPWHGHFGGKAVGGIVEQGAEANFGDQSVSATVTQSNDQNQTLSQNSENNTATATSEANATVENRVRDVTQTQTGTVTVNEDEEDVPPVDGVDGVPPDVDPELVTLEELIVCLLLPPGQIRACIAEAALD